MRLLGRRYLRLKSALGSTWKEVCRPQTDFQFGRELQYFRVVLLRDQAICAPARPRYAPLTNRRPVLAKALGHSGRAAKAIDDRGCGIEEPIIVVFRVHTGIMPASLRFVNVTDVAILPTSMTY